MNGDEERSHLRGTRPTPDEDASRGREAVRLLDFSSVGLVFPVALLLGYFGGAALGGRFGAETLGVWIGLALGFVAGFYNLLKVILRLQKEEKEHRDGVDR